MSTFYFRSSVYSKAKRDFFERSAKINLDALMNGTRRLEFSFKASDKFEKNQLANDLF